ncbi:MAG: M23 family metallopeptidase [Eubacteriales bacterium]|nr:M23 family metallopeptidase [Eubacteriales bacterium]
MKYRPPAKYLAAVALELLLIFVLINGQFMDREEPAAVSGNIKLARKNTAEGQKDYIKWVDFTVPCEALEYAYERDVEAHEAGKELDWVSLLSYTAAQRGGDFSKKAMRELQRSAQQALEEADETQTGTQVLDRMGEELKYYPYYKEAYGAVLSGMVGEYEIRTENGWEARYGLKAYSPIAEGFEYSDFDDFGTARSYGYKRPHLGHDMMGQVGTPIIAIESGYVEAMGWNQYGGWRIGIRSFDKKRYYYYAHLRQNYPFQSGLEEGSVVTAGQVIGYLGHTGYSTQENVNNIETPHLHWGMELVFDESQKESDNEIWIDCYQLSRFLRRNRSQTQKVQGTKEWRRTQEIRDPAVEGWNR